MILAHCISGQLGLLGKNYRKRQFLFRYCRIWYDADLAEKLPKSKNCRNYLEFLTTRLSWLSRFLTALKALYLDPNIRPRRKVNKTRLSQRNLNIFKTIKMADEARGEKNEVKKTFSDLVRFFFHFGLLLFAHLRTKILRELFWEGFMCIVILTGFGLSLFFLFFLFFSFFPVFLFFLSVLLPKSCFYSISVGKNENLTFYQSFDLFWLGFFTPCKDFDYQGHWFSKIF